MSRAKLKERNFVQYTIVSNCILFYHIYFLDSLRCGSFSSFYAPQLTLRTASLMSFISLGASVSLQKVVVKWMFPSNYCTNMNNFNISSIGYQVAIPARCQYWQCWVDPRSNRLRSDRNTITTTSLLWYRKLSQHPHYVAQTSHFGHLETSIKLPGWLQYYSSLLATKKCRSKISFEFILAVWLIIFCKSCCASFKNRELFRPNRITVRYDGVTTLG